MPEEESFFGESQVIERCNYRVTELHRWIVASSSFDDIGGVRGALPANHRFWSLATGLIPKPWSWAETGYMRQVPLRVWKETLRLRCGGVFQNLVFIQNASWVSWMWPGFGPHSLHGFRVLAYCGHLSWHIRWASQRHGATKQKALLIVEGHSHCSCTWWCFSTGRRWCACVGLLLVTGLG